MNQDQAPKTPPRRIPVQVIDAHGHVWSGGKPSPSHRQEPVLYPDLLQEMTDAGVERLVIVSTSWNAGDAYPLEAARAHPDRLGVMGLYDFTLPPDPGRIESYYKQPGMLGIRLFLRSPEARQWMTERSADWLWPVLERAGIPLMIFAGGMIPELSRVAARHPGLKICIDSFGVSLDAPGLASFANYDEVLALARHPNVVIKVQSVPFYSKEAYPFRNFHPIVRRTCDTFGPERVFWGSDLTILKVPYKDCVACMTELDWLSQRDLDLIMGGAIRAWLGWR